MTRVEFVDRLPTKRSARSDYDEIVLQLRAAPGKWAKVSDPSDRKEFARYRAALRSRGCALALRTVEGKLVLFARVTG